MKLTVYLGSGISEPSHLPTVQQLTDEILRPHIGESLAEQRVRTFLMILREYDTADMRRGGLYETSKGIKASGAIYRSGETTYEDLFFLCEQIFLWANGLADHSQTTAFLEAIEERAGEILVDATHERRMFDLSRFGRLGRDRIQSTVASILDRRYQTGLELLYELAQDDDIEELNIVTLNHDTLVEQFFDERGVDYADGFGELDGDVRWSDSAVYDRTDTRIRLFKLHGSINWHSFLHSGFARMTVLAHKDYTSARDGAGVLLRPAVSAPSYLTGISKANWYNRTGYSDIHLRFQILLRQTDRILMSGYGWGDTALNFQLESWLDGNPHHKLILLHRHPEKLMGRSLNMATGFEAWVRLGQIISIKRWMCEVALPEIRAELG